MCLGTEMNPLDKAKFTSMGSCNCAEWERDGTLLQVCIKPRGQSGCYTEHDSPVCSDCQWS